MGDVTEGRSGRGPARGGPARGGRVVVAEHSEAELQPSARLLGRVRVGRAEALIRAGVLSVSCLVTYALFVLSMQGRVADESAFATLSPLSGVFGAPADVVRQVIPFVLAAVAAVLAVMALARRRWNETVRSAVLVAVSLVAAEGLKFALPRPGLIGAAGIAGNSFPSGHVAVTLALALVVVILSPSDRWHVWFAVATGAAAVGVAWCSVLSSAHRPSDVIGSALLVGLLVQALFWRRIAMVDSRPLPGRVALWCIGAGAALVVLGGVSTALGYWPLAAAGVLGWLLLCAAPAAYTVMLAPTGPLSSPRGGGVDER